MLYNWVNCFQKNEYNSSMSYDDSLLSLETLKVAKLMFKTEGEYYVGQNHNNDSNAEFLTVVDDDGKFHQRKTVESHGQFYVVCITQSTFLFGAILLILMILLCVAFLLFVTINRFRTTCKKWPKLSKPFSLMWTLFVVLIKV